ncbi:MAG: hypothetical protein ACK4YV_07695 [Emticicia sp.]
MHEWNLSPDTIGYALFFEKEFYKIIEKRLSLQALPFFNDSNNDAPMVVISSEDNRHIEKSIKK